MIRHEPDPTGCRVVPDQQKPTNMKRLILHIRNRIVYITNQTRLGFINDPDNYAFKEGMPCQTTHKILAPQGFRKEIITKAHNSKFAGHGGRFKTQERLRQDFWWPHMDKDIKEHINQCEPYQVFFPSCLGLVSESCLGLQVCNFPIVKIMVDMSRCASVSDAELNVASRVHRK
jgi:hypothetical protein